MDTRIDQSEHPDRRRHEAHTGPHGQHSAGMVVFLESGASLALCEDDGRVQDLVELGEIEPPAPESQTLVPDSANVGCVWQALSTEVDVLVQAAPSVVVGAVGDGIAETAGSVDLTKGVDGANDGIGLAVVRERVLQAADHGHAGDGRVDCQEDIMSDDESEEGARLCDAPWLVPMLTIVPVEVGDGSEVDGGDGERDLVGQRALVDVFGDWEGVGEGSFAVPWRRNRKWRGVWRELEDSPRREVAGMQRGACARHVGFVCRPSGTRERVQGCAYAYCVALQQSIGRERGYGKVPGEALQVDTR